MNTIPKSEGAKARPAPTMRKHALLGKTHATATFRERLANPLEVPQASSGSRRDGTIARRTAQGTEAGERDLLPFQAPPQVLVPRGDAHAATPPVVNTRVAETQALVERMVTSMRVGRSSRGSEVHMTLDGDRASEVRVREVAGRLEIALYGDASSALAARIEGALAARGLEADVRCER